MYVGCGTLAGKCRWFTVLAFVLLSGALWITFQVEGSKCELCDRPTSTDEEPANCRKWSSSEEEYDVTTMGTRSTRAVVVRVDCRASFLHCVLMFCLYCRFVVPTCFRNVHCPGFPPSLTSAQRLQTKASRQAEPSTCCYL